MFQIHADWMRVATRTEPLASPDLRTASNARPARMRPRWLRWLRRPGSAR